jgi:TPR repeat protein
MPSYRPVVALAVLLFSAGCGSAMARPESPKDCDGGNVQDCKAQCQGSVARACYRLAWFTEEGENGVAKNPKEAVRLYDQACQAKMAVACRALGIVYARGADDVEPNRKRSREYFQQACDLGIPEVCPPPEKQKGQAPSTPSAGAEASGGVSIDASIGK